MPYWNCAGPGFPFWWIFPLFFGAFWLLIIFGFFWRWRWFARGGGPHWGGYGYGGPADPVAILKARFARGEIDQEEYEKRRRTLEA